LITLLQDENSEVREAAAASLGRLGEMRATDALACLLKDAHHQVRSSAVIALRNLGWQPSTREEQALYDIATGNVLAAAGGNDIAADPEIKELKQDTTFIRRAVAEALECVDDPRRIKPLLRALGDKA